MRIPRDGRVHRRPHQRGPDRRELEHAAAVVRGEDRVRPVEALQELRFDLHGRALGACRVEAHHGLGVGAHPGLHGCASVQATTVDADAG